MAREYLPNILKMLLVGGLLIAAGIAEAEPFPAELIGKTITVKRTTNMNIRGEFESTGSMDVSLDININTAGQADATHSLSGRLIGKQYPNGITVNAETDRGADERVHFEGGTLLADSEDLAGTWQVSITFDAGYGTCHATVISRREDVTVNTMRNLLRSLREDLHFGDFKVLSAESSTPLCSVASR
jgi:hypothetical protein